LVGLLGALTADLGVLAGQLLHNRGSLIVTARRADNCELDVHAYHPELQDKVANSGPKPGDWMAVKYLGWVQGRNRTGGCDRYEVIVHTAIDWTRYLDIDGLGRDRDHKRVSDTGSS
jgi:hypothetical protein